MSYTKIFKNEKFFIIILLLVSISLFIGFYFNEDSTGGAYLDYSVHSKISENFSSDFKKTFLEYDKFNTRHTPIIPIFFSIFKSFEINDNLIRFLNLSIPFLIIFFFYQSLTLSNNKINKKTVLLISFLIILSPTIRSLSIWPDSHLFGLLFFIMSLFLFIKFLRCEKNKKIYYAIFNILIFALCCYIRPSFLFFSIYFFWFYLKEFGLSKKLFFLFLLNILLAFPAFYYLFILKIMFLTQPAITDVGLLARINPSNKILIISSIIFFHALPFIFLKINLITKTILNFSIYEHIILFLFFLLNLFFFNYSYSFSGGGIFFHLSGFFGSILIFYAITYIGLICIYALCRQDISNFYLFIIIFLSNPQLSIYHKYYDPLLLILFLLLFNLNIKEEINKRIYIFIFYFHSLLFLLLSINK